MSDKRRRIARMMSRGVAKEIPRLRLQQYAVYQSVWDSRCVEESSQSETVIPVELRADGLLCCAFRPEEYE